MCSKIQHSLRIVLPRTCPSAEALGPTVAPGIFQQRKWKHPGGGRMPATWQRCRQTYSDTRQEWRGLRAKSMCFHSDNAQDARRPSPVSSLLSSVSDISCHSGCVRNNFWNYFLLQFILSQTDPRLRGFGISLRFSQK